MVNAQIKIIALVIIALSALIVGYFKFIYYDTRTVYDQSGNAIIVGHLVKSKNARIKLLTLQLAEKQGELDRTKNALANATQDLDSVRKELVNTRNELSALVAKLNTKTSPRKKK